jgi:hypothetical protein
LLGGLFLKNLAGVEAMVMVQLSFLSILWMESPLRIPFWMMSPLKLSFGYNVNYFQDAYPSKWGFEGTVDVNKSYVSHLPPHTAKFAFKSAGLANNFNMVLLLQLAPFVMMLLSSLVAVVAGFIAKRREEKEDNLVVEQQQQQLGCVKVVIIAANKVRKISL